MNNETKRNLLLGAAGLGALVAGRALARRLRAFDFYGKTVLITGGSRGLGLVMARELAREGARLAICARDTEELEIARRDLQSRGAQVLAVPCDVTDRFAVEELVRVTAKRFGSLDVLINNAGTIQVAPFEATTLEDYEQAMRTHFWAPLYTALAAVPVMKRQGVGRIVNISSIGGKISIPHLLPYSASKHALVGLSDGLRAELKKDNITVTTVCPGLMRTGSPRNATFKGENHEAEYAWFSISDALPVTSISATRAAMQIINSCRYGDAELIISIQAELAVKFRQLFPGITGDLMRLTNSLLPKASGKNTRRYSGAESESEWSPSLLTALNEQAARENNEMA